MAFPTRALDAMPALGHSGTLVTMRQAEDCDCLVVSLFDELGPRLLLYVLSFRLPRHAAEDVLQETFLSLFQHLKQGRSRDNLRGWLFRVAHNLALKWLRSHGHTATRPGLYETCDQQRDPALAADEEVAFKQSHARLQAILKALPERDRLCLTLRAEGMRYREIARTLGLSLGTVSMSISRTLARMARADGGVR